MLAVYTEQGMAGTIRLTDGGLEGSTPALQDMAGQATDNAGGDPQLAYRMLARMNNGRSWAIQT